MSETATGSGSGPTLGATPGAVAGPAVGDERLVVDLTVDHGAERLEVTDDGDGDPTQPGDQVDGRVEGGDSRAGTTTRRRRTATRRGTTRRGRCCSTSTPCRRGPGALSRRC